MVELVFLSDLDVAVQLVLTKFAATYAPEGTGFPKHKTTSEIHELLMEHSGLDMLTPSVLFTFLSKNNYASKCFNDEFVWYLYPL